MAAGSSNRSPSTSPSGAGRWSRFPGTPTLPKALRWTSTSSGRTLASPTWPPVPPWPRASSFPLAGGRSAPAGEMADRRPPLQHYFSADPAIASRPRTRTVRLPDQSVVLHTDRGVFSAGGLDPGTEILLREAPPPPKSGAILDLGCGHGVIAVVLARRTPGARVIAVDVNRRALQLTRINAAENGAGNVEVCEPHEVAPELRFAAVYSKRPRRESRAQLLELLTTWCDQIG